MSALQRLRLAAEKPGGRNVIITRADLLELLAMVAPDMSAPDATGAVTLTEADAGRLAAASWDTATVSRVARYGAWPDAPNVQRNATVEAAYRTLHLLITGQVLGEAEPEGTAC